MYVENPTICMRAWYQKCLIHLEWKTCSSCSVALDLENEAAVAASSSSSSSLEKGMELPDGQGKEFTVGNEQCWWPGVFCLYNYCAEVTEEVSGRCCPFPCSLSLTQLFFSWSFFRDIAWTSEPSSYFNSRKKKGMKREIMCWNFFPLRAGISRYPQNHLKQYRRMWFWLP